MDEKYIQNLYNGLGGESKLGKYDDFKSLISTDDGYRKHLYDGMGGQSKFGDYNDFEGLLKKKDGTTQSQVQSDPTITEPKNFVSAPQSTSKSSNPFEGTVDEAENATPVDTAYEDYLKQYKIKNTEPFETLGTPSANKPLSQAQFNETTFPSFERDPKSKVIQETIADPIYSTLTSTQKKNLIKTKLIGSGVSTSDQIAEQDKAELQKQIDDDERASKDIGQTIEEYQRSRNYSKTKPVYFEGTTYEDTPFYTLKDTDYAIIKDGTKVKYVGDKWIRVNNAEAEQLDNMEAVAQQEFKNLPQNVTKNLFPTDIEKGYITDVNKYLYHLKEENPQEYDNIAEKVLLYRGETPLEYIGEKIGVGGKRQEVRQNDLTIQALKQKIIIDSENYKVGDKGKDLDIIVNSVGGIEKVQNYLGAKKLLDNPDTTPELKQGANEYINKTYTPTDIENIEEAISIQNKIYEGRNKINFANQNIVKDIYNKQVFQRSYNAAAQVEKARLSQADAGKAIWNASLDFANGIVQLPKRLETDKEYGFWDMWSDSFNEATLLGKGTTAQRTTFNSETGEWDGSAILPNVTGGLASMILLARGGGMFGKATGIGYNAGIVASGFALTHNDLYQQAKESNLMTEEQAQNFSIVVGAAISLSELISPGEKIFGEGKSAALNSVMKEFAKGKPLSTILKGKDILKETGFEMIQEATQDLEGVIANGLSNTIIGKDALSTEYNISQFAETMTTTAAVTLLSGGFRGIVSRGHAREELVNKIAQNNVFDIALKTVQDNVNSGIITEKKGVELTEELTQRNAQINALPKEYSDSKKEKIIELQQQLLPYQKQEYDVDERGNLVKKEVTKADEKVIEDINKKISDIARTPNEYFDNENKTVEQKAAEVAQGNPAPIESAMADIGEKTPEQIASELKPVIDEAKNIDSGEEKDFTVGEMINTPVVYNGQNGTIYQDGKALVFKVNGQNKEFELGNVDEISNRPLSDFNIVHEQSVVSFGENGEIKIRDKTFVNNFSDPLAAINRDPEGNILSVNLETADGKKRTFRGNVAEDLAYQITSKHNELSLLTVKYVDYLISENEIIEDCGEASDGANFGFTKGGKWVVVKDLKGYPTHKKGGVDITIGINGVNIKNNNSDFKAKFGLVISTIND